jgi:hypothetical protein
MPKFSLKKYNIGSPKRIHVKKRSTLKKYNIGPPRRPSYEMELTEVIPSTIKFSTPKAKKRTPEKVTPRTEVWENWAKKGEVGYIDDYEPDDDAILAKKKREKMGIRSPEKYTTFEEIQTNLMKNAYKKKPLTDIIDQVEEEEWEQKEDDPGGVIEERGKGSRRRRNQRSRNRRSRKSRRR